MLDLQEQTKPSVSLEQLLQLKRAERPGEAFWEEFDRELRRRQLAALVSVQPWHERFIRASLTFLKRVAPVAAAAFALAAGIISVNRSDRNAARPIYTAGSSSEARYVILPEEHISAPARVEVSAGIPKAAAQATDATARYAVREFGFSSSASRSFSTVAAPLTFSVPSDVSNVYMVNTLTALPAFEAKPQAEAASF